METLIRGWREIMVALQEDFSDVPDVGTLTKIVVRLVMAALLGALLGYDREKAGKPAGLRTHMLVALGAALFILIPQQAGVSDRDLTRALQGLITGIGFLGAGSILKDDEGRRIEGLTTAASIWLTAAIGVAAGMGRESTAALCTALAWVILAAVPRIERWMGTDIPNDRHAKPGPGKP